MAERTAETFAALGAEVANKMIKQGADMTQTVGALRISLNLNPEETRRVCEQANRAAFANYFYSGGSDERDPRFALADASKILPAEPEASVEMKKAASYGGKFVTPRTDRFSTAKLRSTAFDTMMEKGAALLQKTAAAPVERPVGVQWETARSLLGKARENKHVAEYHFEKAAEELRQEAREVLRTMPLEHMLQALMVDPEFTKSAGAMALATLKPLVDGLRESHLLKQASWQEDVPAVNLDHPLMRAFQKTRAYAAVVETARADFEKAAAEEARLRKEVIRAHTS